ncbi:amino acid adenylation domain-containing protein [Nonomuraea sp. LP-02]|uniref:non-ribosomal peptide synthetase n=1 Tax=Nonomuraea sp. LP-02 TaxID=3097960 RepID=UPI002E303B54|nr:non-ribosomal peptide synthetase [Nonomuraea sp. LP-02]MED7924030.1 amino acid adenylation domain-containing protein [Nonomuraea sp. LP-02]
MTPSYAQEGMWIAARMGAGPAYHLPLALWFDGDLDVDALLSACAAVVARHPVLATTVTGDGGGARLTMAGEPPVTLARPSGPDALERLVRDEVARPFDLDGGPVARFTLAPAGPGRHLLLFVAHHLVFDGMSKDILVRDLARFYATGARGPVTPLPFAPAAAAERGRAEAALPAARAFWAGRRTEPAELVLPGQRRTVRRHGPGVQSGSGVEAELGENAAAVARAAGATTFEVLLAAVHALLYRYTDPAAAEATVVGIDVTTRDAATRDHVGPFVNELPVLARPSAGQAFAELVKEVRAELRELYRFREVPPARALGLPRGAAVPVTVSYRRRADDPEPDWPGLDVTVDRMMFGGGVRNPLHLQFVDGGDGLALCLRHDPAALDAAAVERFADGLRALLRHAARDPGARLADLDVLGPAERRRLLTAWNDTAADYPPEATLPALFAAQVRARPDAVAVTGEGRSLTYAELDAASDRLAGRLRAAGVGRGDLVAVHLRRSARLPVCLLAVLKAGAAYLPLDPDHPAGRLAMITEDARPRLVLSEDVLPQGLTVPVVPVDGGGPAPEPPPGEGPRPGDLAYVIYTSGSTGRPKGVEVEHRNLANLLLAMRDRLDAGPAHVWLALTSPAFDISALELYLPLAFGGRVVVAPPGAVRAPAALAALAVAEGVTHVQATPSVWRLLLPGGIGGVTALAGGEALPPALATELRGRCPRVVNVYGPTETTIWSTYAEVGADEEVTIGRPLANTRIHLLDERLRPVPQGVAGELCVGGAGVARGYRGAPGLTAGRFVADPFGPPGSRLYRTGDLARHRPDGALEFLGREDGQLKLLGHRVEPAEIEARLTEHPGVAGAAVALRGGRLVAWVVPAPGAEPDPAELSAHLAGTLPAPMVPAAYVTVDALPLNPVGKLDRAALPDAPRAPRPAPAPAPVPAPVPAAGLAEEVRGIWREVLELDEDDEIGPDEDLFDLGGHSLTIAQITARIRERLGVEVTLDAFFDDPTVEGVAAEIARLRDAPREEPGEGPRPRPAGTAPPLSFAQERLWFLQRLDPDDASYNMYLVLRLDGPLDVAALLGALEAVVARHESLRTSFGDVDGEPVAVVRPPGPVVVERLDAGSAPDPEEEARRLVAERVNRPFDLAEAPPLRISLLGLGPGTHVLCFVLHHVIADGASLGVLFDDLFALYLARVAGREAALPPLPVQYGDVALWQRERDTGAEAEESLAYWRRRLADPPALELPPDLPGGGRAEGAFHAFRVPDQVVARLERLAQEQGASLFMVLAAAYQALLARHTGQRDVLVGTPWAARDRVELEPVIGYLTDTLVLRGDLGGDPAFRDLLAATRRSVLEAHAHRTVPFERLIGELGVPRDLRRNPLLSTMVILHSQAGDGTPPERMGELRVRLFEADYRQAKFDLALETWRDEHGLRAVLGYDAARYAAATAEGLAARFAVLLEGVAADPDRPLSRLPMLTEADEAALTWDEAAPMDATEPWPGPGAGPAPEMEPVPVLFARAVAADPAATALVCGADRIGYGELDRRAAVLAAALRRRGVAEGSVVGVCLGRSVEAIVALLAVWRAGGAYLPLDPEHPDERLAFLIADSGARLVVTDAEPALRLPPGTPVLVPSDCSGSGDDRWLGGWAAPGPQDPAYVIYTSGSTGRPKGVVVGHGALAARVAWMRRAYGLGPGDRVAQFASLGFDAHAEELYPALAAGASVLLLPGGAATLPDVLRTPAGREVTVLDLPTAYWHRLTESPGDVRWPERLRLVILGGEQAHAAAVARWREWFGDRVRLVNTYGPTEATVIATAATLGASDAVRRPPIGRPVAGTTAYVLGPHGEAVPPGFPGELCLGGAGLAHGYLNRPALTAERFVPDPYGRPGSRLYRTGDRVRWRPGGTLEFLGRLDGQLKVRGFRVEPGEVEAALLACPGVRQAVVTAYEERLVAYVAGEAATEELRRALAGTLPAHLVPSAWVRLDALPLTTAGKVDAAALPPPGAERAAEHVPPRTDAEALVAGVWTRVLGLDGGRVGALDDFFALGGHSLLATRVAALLGNAVEVEVPVRAVFDRPTVAGLAEAVEELLMEHLSDLSDAEAARLLDAEPHR